MQLVSQFVRDAAKKYIVTGTSILVQCTFSTNAVMLTVMHYRRMLCENEAVKVTKVSLCLCTPFICNRVVFD